MFFQLLIRTKTNGTFKYDKVYVILNISEYFLKNLYQFVIL
jgi:hypothetical protein